MRVLVACEFSGIVRDAFAARGHDAWSCDIIPSEAGGQHYTVDARQAVRWGSWDLIIAHPPCTDIAVSGAAWFKRKLAADPECQNRALDFVRFFLNSASREGGTKICVENPVSIISTRIEKPTQIIQPWQFGHGEVKKTCLWLRGLPPLIPTDIVEGREQRVHWMGPSPNRGRERSRFFPGVAAAMADQWGPT